MKVIGISGSLASTSRTTALVHQILLEFARTAGADVQLISIADLAPALGAALSPDAPDLGGVFRQVQAADALVVATPVYKASYTGLLKHFFDLLDPNALRGKTALLAATGGSERHALVIEHQLRPLLSFFDAHTVPTGIYLHDQAFEKDADGRGYRLRSEEAGPRIKRAVSQALVSLGHASATHGLPQVDAA